MARPGKRQAGHHVEWQVAPEAPTFEGKVPGDEGQQGAEQNPRIDALQAEFPAEKRLNLLAESWLIQVSLLENPHQKSAVPFQQPPEDETDKGCPSENTNPQDSALL
jgi:hypothetical protein